jgi:hypothetical protein
MGVAWGELLPRQVVWGPQPGPLTEGGMEGRSDGANELSGPTSQMRKKTREQGKQNKMCAFVNM